MDLVRMLATVGVFALLSWLLVAYHASRDRRVWREYYDRQIAEIERRERLGLHARRVTAAGAPSTRVAIGFVHDEVQPFRIGPRTIRARGIDLVDKAGATLTLPAGADVEIHDLPGASWRRAEDQAETAFDLTVMAETAFYVLVEGGPAGPADPYRDAPPPPALARVPRDLVLSNPWIDLGPTYQVASDPRAFDLEVTRRGGFRAWIVGLAITVLLAGLAAATGDVQVSFAVGIMSGFVIGLMPGLVLAIPIPRRKPPEPPRTWRAEER